MKNSIKFFFPIMAVAVTSYGLSTAKHHKIDQLVLAADIATEENGLIAIASPYDVPETGDRLESIIEAKGLTLFARIDHSANASNAELELNPTELLIFGNPKVGTPLMQCSISTAIDLPQKILIYQDESDRTHIAYNNPEYLQKRHDIEGCDEVLTKVEGALTAITEEATGDAALN